MVTHRRQPNLRLQEARALKGWTQEELAAQLGTTFETVSRWERGLMLPTPYFRTRLCAVFGMSAEELGLHFEADIALDSSLWATRVVVAWAALDKEHETVGHVLTTLQARGTPTVSPWLLGRHGPAHKQKNLDEAIRVAQLVLLILSPHSSGSRDVRATAQLAQLYSRPLAALWIAGEQLQQCLPLKTPSFLRVIDARAGEKETVARDVHDLLEQTAPAERAETQGPLPVETSLLEESFEQNVVDIADLSAEEDRLAVEPGPLSRLQARNRQRLLDKVHAFWITGVLEHSLHGMAFLTLGLSTLPNAVEHPWRFVLEQPHRTPLLLKTGTTIRQVYDEACGELLILGEPGAGKTTLLLALARDLIVQAKDDETHPLPVIFNLSSWSQKKLPLGEWLADELHLKYQVPHQLGRSWVQADSLLPLLDGVDEVAAEHREACIKAINAFRWEHGLLPMVVCSRSNDYFMQPQRIVLHRAVTVQPLAPGQIEAYVEQAGASLSALRVALHQDAALYELTSTPLMLSILTLTYHDMPAEELLPGGSLTERRQQIFKRYVERMLRHRGIEKRYTREQTTHWLMFLAQQMKQQNQTIFYLEHLQPAWLSGERMPQAYDRWALRFPAILIGVPASLAIGTLLQSLLSPSPSGLISVLPSYAVLGGFIGWLLQTGSTAPQPHQSSGRAGGGSWSRLVGWLRVGVLVGLLGGLSGGPGVGLSFGLSIGLGSILLQAVFEKSKTTALSSRVPPRSRKPKRRLLTRHAGVKNGMLIGLFLGLSAGLGYGLGFGPISGPIVGLIVGLIFGLIFGLDAGLSGGLLSALLIGKPVGISPTDELVWSWRSLGRGLVAKKHMNTTVPVMVLAGLGFGLIFGLGAGLNGGLVAGLIDGLVFGPSMGLSIGLILWSVLGLFQGVTSETIEDHHRVVPNQGIRRSARNGLALGLISTAIVWLVCGLSVGLSVWLSSGPRSYWLSMGLVGGLIIGLSTGLLAGFLNGGLACLRHYVLRFLLWRDGSIPWNYPHFLDYAAESILLGKVGGGYIFIHRLLLEYFASLESTPKPDAARVKSG